MPLNRHPGEGRGLALTIKNLRNGEIPAFAGMTMQDRVGGMRQPCVHILTNRSNMLFYVGVTSDIAARMMQHRAGKGSSHCRRYKIYKLVHVEFHATMHDAIAREKALKEWHRDWKRRLITEGNPVWEDLFDKLLA